MEIFKMYPDTLAIEFEYVDMLILNISAKEYENPNSIVNLTKKLLDKLDISKLLNWLEIDTHFEMCSKSTNNEDTETESDSFLFTLTSDKLKDVTVARKLVHKIFDKFAELEQAYIGVTPSDIDDTLKEGDVVSAETVPEPKKEVKVRNRVPDNLTKWLTDITYKVSKNEVVLIGREKELERMAQVLSRKKKRNVCLLGEAGVGKTTIVEGLATKMLKTEDKNLKGKHILELDLSAALAGAKYRGDFEDRINKCLSFITENKDLILFLDEIHSIVGAGAAEGAMDTATILKPILTNERIQLIGATTYAEYKSTIERDKALARRFQLVSIEEPTKEQTVEILKGTKKIYEDYHNVLIDDSIIYKVIDLADRYLVDRNFPDKAFDIIDESCVLSKRESNTFEVTEHSVLSVVANMARIPITKLTESDSERLNKLSDSLKARVLGQEEAISAITRTIRRNRLGISEGNRPIGSFLFVGTTGTGKTELAKALASEWFGTEKALLKVDMSEYMEKHSVAKLIGSPAGYVGYEDGGALTQKVKAHPYSVVLFDEVEKAHPDVLNILLQLLDEGVLTDAYSGLVNFKNTIIILTSNIGATEVKKTKCVGFGNTQVEEKREDTYKSAVKDYFKPELLNRLDNIIYFNELNNDVTTDIVNKLMTDLTQRIEKLGYTLEYTEDVVKYIVEGGYNRDYGVRELKRFIINNIENKIADTIIDGVDSTKPIKLIYEDNELKVVQEINVA